MKNLSDYSEFSLNELINKISTSRYWNLPKMLAEAFRRLLTRVEALEDSPSGGIESVTGDFVDNTDPLNPVLEDPRPYKVYTALLTQSGTNAPVATVLENNTGLNITYQYLLVGKYAISLNSPVPKQTVTIEMSNFRYGSTLGDGGILFLEMIDDVANIGTYELHTKFRTNAAATISFLNNALLNNKIEIRVYN